MKLGKKWGRERHLLFFLLDLRTWILDNKADHRLLKSRPNLLSRPWISDRCEAKCHSLALYQLERGMFTALVDLHLDVLRGMGNIYATNHLQQLPTAQIPKTTLLGPEFRCSDTGICLSEMVSVPFFSGKHLEANVERGPFKNSRDWLAARLHLHIYDIDNASEPDSDSSDDGDDEYESTLILHLPRSRNAALNAYSPCFQLYFQKSTKNLFSTTTISTPAI